MRADEGIILAAGIGRRLDSLETPKPLVHVGGESLVVRTARLLKEAGVKRFLVVIQKGDTRVPRELSSLGFEFVFIEQPKKNATMLESVLLAFKETRGNVIVTVCDLVAQKNPYLVLNSRQIRQGDVGILVSTKALHNEQADANAWLRFSDRELKYTDESPHALEVGAYFFTAKSLPIFERKARAVRARNVQRVFEALYPENRVSLFKLDAQWFDINNPATLIRAELFLRKGKKKDNILTARHSLPVLTTFEYEKPLTFDVVLERGILGKISEYEVIPFESFHSPHHLLVDKNIDTKYGKRVHSALLRAGFTVEKILIDPGERTKSFETYGRLAQEIIDAGIDKKSFIISLGGGVVKDVAGFLASTLYRGIGFISIPTTVLSQCDAAIALKQGVNGPQGKNLLGSFYPPLRVIVDPDVLKTLPPRYVYDGLAECLKQAFAQDASFFEFFNKYQGPVVKDIDFLEEVARRAISLKVSSISRDYDEEKIALVNQYGHEVGHAVEYLSGYEFGHGESVAIGMRVSAEIARLLDISDDETLAAHKRLLGKFKLPYTVPKTVSAKDIIDLLRYNKKFHGGEPRFVLVSRIGSIWHKNSFHTVSVSDALLAQAIEKSYEA